MKPRNPSSGIDRRALVSTLALLPALSGTLLPRSAPRAGDARRCIVVVERRACETGDRRLRAHHHRPVERELRRPRGAHRGVRPGRHPLGRASDVLAGGLLPGPRAGGGGEEAGAQERRAVQDRALGQPRGDRQALDARAREDSRRHADRHAGGGVQRRSQEVARHRQASSLESSLYRARLSADARSAALPARQRVTRPTS